MEKNNRASLKNIAEEAGVSIITASRALDSRRAHMLKENTRKKILDSAEKLNYTSNISARRFKRGKTETISFVMPRNAFENPVRLDFSPFSGSMIWQMIEGIIKEARKWNYDIKIEPLFEPENPDAIISRLGYPYSDGVILCGIWELENIEKKIKVQGIPYVVMASEPSRLPELPEIAADFGSGLRDAMHYLTEQKHKNIAIFTPSPETNIPGSRLAEARDYLLSKGCFREDLVYTVENESKFCSIIDKIAETSSFTAAFCHNDTMALMLIKELRKRKIDCPGNVSVIGFDDNPAYKDKGLSTVSVPRKELGSECVKILIGQIERNEEFNGRKLLPTSFIRRNTC